MSDVLLELTDNELEVLRGMSRGELQSSIARRIGLSESRVDQLVASIKMKFDAPTQTAAVARAVKKGLVDPE